MAKSNNFQVRVTGDTTKFDAAMSRAQRELREFGNIASKAFSIIGITSFAAAMRSAVSNIADFEKANSELAAVLGTTKKGVEGLANSAKQLGVQSKYTATEVTQLQVSLSRLGFDAGQIEAMQSSILKFATAMDTDLASAADFTGAALRAFGLQAKDTSAMLDVMAASTTNSALDFSKLQSSISIVAPIAKAFGLDVKEVAALLGVLANNGFDASAAATALRNILLNLADANGKLSKGIGHSVKNFDEMIAAFQELDKKGVDVNAVLEMTDKRSAAAAVTIIKQAGAVQDLKVQLDGCEGSLETMADTMQDNLIGSVTSLKSAWEGFTLTLSNSAGPLKRAVDGLTELLRALSGNDAIGIQNRELEELSKGIAAQNLAATLTNGGALSKAEQQKYDQLKAEGYIAQNGYQELDRGQDAEGYFKTIRRSNEYGLWGAEQRVAMTEKEIEEYKKATETVNNTTNAVKGLTQQQKDALASTQSWARALVSDIPVDDVVDLQNQVSKAASDAFNSAVKSKKTTAEAQAAAQKAVYDAIHDYAKAAASDAAEVVAADAEMAQAANETYEAWRKLNSMENHPFNNDELLMYAQALKEVVDYEKELSDLDELLASNQDALNERLTKAIDHAEELATIFSEELLKSLESGLIGAFNALADAIGGVTEGGFENVAKAMIEPLADMAIRIGTIIMLSGEAIEALKAGLLAFFGGSPILAGAALIAVGVAAKAGLAALGNNNYASSSSYVASGSYGNGGGDYETRDVNIHVTGQLRADGDQLVAVIENTTDRNNYTT